MSGEDLPQCSPEIFKKGKHLATIIDLEPSEIERIVKDAAKSSGQRIDWHYFGGRACVKALGDLDSARRGLQEALKSYEGKYGFV